MIQENRHQLVRAKKRAENIARLFLFRFPLESEAEHAESIRLFARHHYRNRKSCSCHMCRNPRHSIYHKGASRLTRQEVKAQICWEFQLLDLERGLREESCYSGG